MTYGRNDPCPCGSGRKYKKCCLASDEAAQRALAPRHAVREAALRKLMEFGFGPDFDTDREIGEMLFWANRLQNRKTRDIQPLLESDDCEVKYRTWFLFDLDIENGRTVVELFLESEGETLTSGERDFLERLRRAPLALYEVEAVEPDRGVQLVDLWTNARVFVRERLATREIVRWDLLGARVVPDEDGAPVFEGGLYL